MQLVAARKRSLCLDANTVSSSFLTRFANARCVADKASQTFQLVAPAAAAPRFMLRLASKTEACMDDGGGSSDGASQAWMAVCAPTNGNQVFSWDGSNIRVPGKKKFCIDDGDAERSGAATRVRVFTCNKTSANQQWAMRNVTGGTMLAAAKKKTSASTRTAWRSTASQSCA